MNSIPECILPLLERLNGEETEALLQVLNDEEVSKGTNLIISVNPVNILTGLFTWTESKQGAEFWAEVHSRLWKESCGKYE